MAEVEECFAAAMQSFGPFEPDPSLAVAVSGGPDSMALALLACDWARQRGGCVLALIVDHGLRAESAAEAAVTAQRLAACGIASRLLTLAGLRRGPALAERARAARYDILLRTCANEGILHLLLGHHARDQAETLMMRVLGGSGDRGLAAMPALAETHAARVLRPLLDVMPQRLRGYLKQRTIEWVDDPSNRDPGARRARLRLAAALHDPADEAGADMAGAATAAGRRRAEQDRALAAFLAAHVTIRPEGFALIPSSAMPPAALAAVVQTISGAPYPPKTDSVAPLAASPHPATLAGVRLLVAGRLGLPGQGLLAIREEQAIGCPVDAVADAVWDGRFRLAGSVTPPPGLVIGALGDDARRFRRVAGLPAAVLRVLPAIRAGNSLVSVPHLLYPDPVVCARMRLVFAPRRPLAGAPFFPAIRASDKIADENGDAGRQAAPYVETRDAGGSTSL